MRITTGGGLLGKLGSMRGLRKRHGKARSPARDEWSASDLLVLGKLAAHKEWTARHCRRDLRERFLSRGLVRKINGPGAIELFEVTDAGRALVASRAT